MPTSHIYEKSPQGCFRQGEFLTNIILYQHDYQVQVGNDGFPMGKSKQIQTIIWVCFMLKPRSKIVWILNHPSTSLIEITFPYAIVVTQDCDLEQDYIPRSQGKLNNNRIVKNVLLCEAMDVREFLTKNQELRESDSARKLFLRNKDERYHYLQNADADDDAIGEGLPGFCVSFKTYFTVPTDYLYHLAKMTQTMRRCVLKSPYLEHFSSRFHYYHSRVALPQDHSYE